MFLQNLKKNYETHVHVPLDRNVWNCMKRCKRARIRNVVLPCIIQFTHHNVVDRVRLRTCTLHVRIGCV